MPKYYFNIRSREDDDEVMTTSPETYHFGDQQAIRWFDEALVRLGDYGSASLYRVGALGLSEVPLEIKKTTFIQEQTSVQNEGVNELRITIDKDEWDVLRLALSEYRDRHEGQRAVLANDLFERVQLFGRWDWTYGYD